jgi:NADPH2:quinone reductase
VTKYAVGDRLVSHGSLDNYGQNGLQEYAVADLYATAKIPPSISDDEAATLPTCVFAPLCAIFDSLNLPAPWADTAQQYDRAGTTLLIVGGGSSCGRFGVQLAKLANIGKIVVVGGNEKELKAYGATQPSRRR